MQLNQRARRGTSFARRGSLEEALDLEKELMDVKALTVEDSCWIDHDSVIAGCEDGEVTPAGMVVGCDDIMTRLCVACGTGHKPVRNTCSTQVLRVWGRRV